MKQLLLLLALFSGILRADHFEPRWPAPYICEAHCCYVEAKASKCDYVVADDENLVAAYKKMKSDCQIAVVKKGIDPQDSWLRTLDGSDYAYVGNSCRKHE